MKPLHVQVAEALGWEAVNYYEAEAQRCGRGPVDGWRGCPPPDRYVEFIPRYDTDWAAIGPLIEKYDISIMKLDDFNADCPETWSASAGGAHGWDDGLVPFGTTPLEAVCRLILALKEAGRLDE